MNILVACEYSGTVRDAFAERGHNAWSCDILPTESPGNHFKCDVKEILRIKDWDLIIAHPPCTALCVTGNRTYAGSQDRIDAAEFVKDIWEAECDKVCIENPVGVINSILPEMPRPYYIQPWMWGDTTEKKTGLWTRGLPQLVADVTEKPEIEYVEFNGGTRMTKWYYETSCLPHAERAHARSKTFPGIARAMAEQWG